MRCMVVFLLLLTLNQNTKAQDLSEHRWNDRVLLLLTLDTAKSTYKSQVKFLTDSIRGLEERKLVVYHVTPRAFKKGLQSKALWQQSAALFERYVRYPNVFQVTLIGLDGGVKLQKEGRLSTKELFRAIDAMPMRASEMRRKNQ